MMKVTVHPLKNMLNAMEAVASNKVITDAMVLLILPEATGRSLLVG